MSEDREHLYICEECSKPIYEGDQYQDGGECVMCPEHAGTLADALRFWEAEIQDPDRDSAAWGDHWDTIEEAQAYVEELRAQIERDGPDFKPLSVA